MVEMVEIGSGAKREVEVYHVNEDHSYIVVAQLSPDFVTTEARVMGSIFEGLWMTSQEITDEVKKEHKNVMRDIRILIPGNKIDRCNFEHISLPDSYGRHN